jgi:hypothetical protein
MYKLLSPAVLDLHTVFEARKRLSETHSQAPIIQIPEMALERGINQPLIILGSQEGGSRGHWLRRGRICRGGG